MLLATGASVNIKKRAFVTNLLLASWADNKEPAWLLLEDSASVKLVNGSYSTALEEAASSGKYKHMHILIEYVAHFKGKDRKNLLRTLCYRGEYKGAYD